QAFARLAIDGRPVGAFQPNWKGRSSNSRGILQYSQQSSVNGRVFDIGQLGPDFVILRDAGDHPPAEAEITFSIDGRTRRWPVLLPDGITPARTWTRTAPLPQANGAAEKGDWLRVFEVPVPFLG